MNEVPLYIKNAIIYTEKDGVINGSLLLVDGLIHSIHTEDIPTNKLPKNTHTINAKKLNVIPGFIDGHIHGAAGADVMDGTKNALDVMAKALPKEGTTSFLATTITQAPENINKVLKNIANCTTKPKHAELLGIHLEGPFIEKEKAGAQPVQHIIKPNVNIFKKWQTISDNKIKTITLAPELDKNGEFIQYLSESGINVSAGHTNINYEGMTEVVKYGVRQVTHLCNAMSGIHHRDIGVVGATFYIQELRAELIADGIHVSKEMMQMIYDNIGSERLILITDAMRAKGLNPGTYDLGGQDVIVLEDRAKLPSGSLAGSILKMDEGARIMLELKGVTLSHIIEMASVNPAKQINIFDRKGGILEKKDADLLIVDDDLHIKYTICRGAIAHKEEVNNENF